MSDPIEQHRLSEAARGERPWKKWGPYLSERQWGTVRENLSRGVEAWNDLTHDQSRSRAYQSGEDGIAGFCDDQMLLCFAVGLWNGKDPIIKERLFGLTNSEGNHGEDVKEYYFYLDSTPTHAYAKMLYKYPQAAFPYEKLVAENRRRSRNDFEYELLDTGVFDENRYWDVYVEYAKGDPEDIHIRITRRQPRPRAGVAARRCPSSGSATPGGRRPDAPRPAAGGGHRTRAARWSRRTTRCWGSASCTATAPASCCSPTTRPTTTGCGASRTRRRIQKDGINDYIVNGRKDAVNPDRRGTKVRLAPSQSTVAPGQSVDRSAPPDRRCRRARSPIRSGRLRPDLRGPQARGRRVLRSPDPGEPERRRGQRRPPGIRRPAVDEAGLRLRRRGLAEGARR